MDFDAPAKHRMTQDIIREFCEEEIIPIAQNIEDEHRFPAEIFDQLAELDVMSVPTDGAYGGLDGDQLVCALVVEGLGRVSGGIGLSYVAHVSLASKPIELFGTDEQKERRFTPLATGEHLGGWTPTEPGSGNDASDMDAVAERNSGGYVIDGTRQFIMDANVAGPVLVKAVTDPGAGYGGISAFIVDPESDDGFKVMTEWDEMGLNSSPTCELPFGDCWVPEDRLFGEEGGGWKQAMRTFDGGHIFIAALSVGLAGNAYGHAKSYVQKREQPDRPVSKFDAIRDKPVSMHRKTGHA